MIAGHCARFNRVTFFFHFKAPFCKQGPRSVRIRTQCSVLKSGSQLSRKSERLHHPTGHASSVCRTFEMILVQEVGWTPGPVWTCAENLAPPGFDPRTVQPVGSRYTDYTTQPTQEEQNMWKARGRRVVRVGFRV